MRVSQPELHLPNVPVELVARDRASSYGVIGNIAVVIGFSDPDVPAISNYETTLDGLVKRHPAAVGLITVIQSNSTPEPAARERLLQMFKRHGSTLHACVFVDEERGFAAAVHRAIGAGLIMATGKRATIRIEAGIPAGVAWFVSKWRLPRNVGSVTAVTQLCTRISDFQTTERLLRK